jgi:hypothetical protein
MKTAKYGVKPRLIVCNAQHDVPGERRHNPQDVIFNSDSFLIQIDSSASRTSGKGNYCSTQKFVNFPQNFAQNKYFSHCIPPPHDTVIQILWMQCAQV